MSVNAALAEAYASGDEEGVWLTAAELDHASFDEPVRVVTGADDLDPEETVDLPLGEGGPRVPHRPCAFGFIRPGADRDGPTDAKIRMDGVSAELSEHLEAAGGYNQALRLTIRQYRVLPGQLAAVTDPEEVIAGMQVREVELTEDSAEGAAGFPDGRQMNVPTGPYAFFDRDTYPGLFG